MPVDLSPAPLALTHLNLDVRDLDASERFYRDRLGLPVERKPGLLRIRGPRYLLVLNEGKPRVGGSFHFGFCVPRCEDVDAWVAGLRDGGAPILVEPNDAGAVYVARIADPDGYEIEIYADLV